MFLLFDIAWMILDIPGQISFEAKAPPGYTFIPAGTPQLTNACKETCRKEGRKVFAVTVSDEPLTSPVYYICSLLTLGY